MAERGCPNDMFEYAKYPNDEDSLILRIIAKTKMNTGFRYLALDETKGRILRPIFNTPPGNCYWPKKDFELELDDLYNFRVIAHPDRDNYCTPFPHCNEDLIVFNLEKESILQPPTPSPLLPESGSQVLFEPQVGGSMQLSIEDKMLPESGSQVLFEPQVGSKSIEDKILPEPENGIVSLFSPQPAFLSLAKLDVQDIFGPNVIKEHCYVYENTPCCSAGILRSLASIEYDEDKKKYYCKVECVSGTYNMPVEGLDIGEIEYSDALIVLELDRPFKGGQFKFDPARCYLLVVGIYPLPKQNGQPINQ